MAIYNKELEREMAKEYEKEIDFAERLKNLAVKEKSKIIHLEGAVLIVSTLLMNSSIKTYDAIIFVAQQGFGQQALTLVRAILENSINFQYIVNDPEDRSRQYLEYTKKERYKLVEALEKAYGAEAVGNLFSEEVLRSVKRDYENIGFNFSDKKYRYSWSGKPIKKMAEETGFEFHYDVLYRILCYHTHSSPSGVISGVKAHANEEKVDISYGPSKELVGEAFLYSYDPFIRIIGNYNDLHNLGFDDKIEMVVEEYERFRQQ